MANFKVGDKIKFAEEKQRYTVKAVSGRYLIYTKPFNLDDLLKGNVDVSRRNCVPLNIEGGETCVNT